MTEVKGAGRFSAERSACIRQEVGTPGELWGQWGAGLISTRGAIDGADTSAGEGRVRGGVQVGGELEHSR